MIKLIFIVILVALILNLVLLILGLTCENSTLYKHRIIIGLLFLTLSSFLRVYYKTIKK
jgi:hypothetical protein